MNDLIAAFVELTEKRRSVRGFLPQPVSSETLGTVFTLAQRAPSNCNTQPWKVAVASGDSCNRLREKMTAAVLQGKMTPDLPYDGNYQQPYKKRQHEAAAALYDAMGIDRNDKAARQRAFMRNFSFFDAPHIAFLLLPEPFGIREAADLGMYAQNLILSMTAHGIASVPMTSVSFQAQIIHEELDISPNNRVLFGIAFGYEDSCHPTSKAITGRAKLDDTVSFYE